MNITIPHPLRSRRARKEAAITAAENRIDSHIRMGIGELIGQLTRHPITVNHTVEKIIPEPIRMEVIAEQPHGAQTWRTSVDMTYRNMIPVIIPMNAFTGDPADYAKQVCLRFLLHYEPGKRRL